MGYTFDVTSFDATSSEDLIDVLSSRGFIVSGFEYRNEWYALASEIWQLRRTNRDYQEKLDYMLAELTGKVV
jgi:hypothetical protein